MQVLAKIDLHSVKLSNFILKNLQFYANFYPFSGLLFHMAMMGQYFHPKHCYLRKALVKNSSKIAQPKKNYGLCEPDCRVFVKFLLTECIKSTRIGLPKKDIQWFEEYTTDVAATQFECCRVRDLPQISSFMTCICIQKMWKW